MAPIVALFFVLGWTSSWVCVRGSCGAQPEPAAAPGAAGCGCGSLERAAVVEKLEDVSAPAEPAVKYSRGANERDAEERDSQVICLLQQILNILKLI